MHSLLLATILTIPGGHYAAPVYVHQSDQELKRVGTYIYKPTNPNVRVLYCIATPPSVYLSCVVRTPDDRLILAEYVRASEHAT